MAEKRTTRRGAQDRIARAMLGALMLGGSTLGAIGAIAVLATCTPDRGASMRASGEGSALPELPAAGQGQGGAQEGAGGAERWSPVPSGDDIGAGQDGGAVDAGQDQGGKLPGRPASTLRKVPRYSPRRPVYAPLPPGAEPEPIPEPDAPELGGGR